MRSKTKIVTLQDIFLPEYRVETKNGCWEWQGKRTRYGYGVFQRKRRTIHVHRAILEALTGPLNDLCALHKCDNPPCFRPDHLFRGTIQDNHDDMNRKGRAKRCMGRPGKSGVLGVIWIKAKNKWQVVRMENRKRISYGLFDDLSNALEFNKTIPQGQIKSVKQWPPL